MHGVKDSKLSLLLTAMWNRNKQSLQVGHKQAGSCAWGSADSSHLIELSLATLLVDHNESFSAANIEAVSSRVEKQVVRITYGGKCAEELPRIAIVNHDFRWRPAADE